MWQRQCSLKTEVWTPSCWSRYCISCILCDRISDRNKEFLSTICSGYWAPSISCSLGCNLSSGVNLVACVWREVCSCEGHGCMVWLMYLRQFPFTCTHPTKVHALHVCLVASYVPNVLMSGSGPSLRFSKWSRVYVTWVLGGRMCGWVTMCEQTFHKNSIGHILGHYTCCNGNTLLFMVCVPNLSRLNITSSKGRQCSSAYWDA
jgi:hypothetical protein